jgi:hypothetical protein
MYLSDPLINVPNMDYALSLNYSELIDHADKI